MKAQTFFFDLGGVLVDFSHEKMCQNIAYYCGLDLNLVKRNLFEKNIGEKYELGEMNSQDVYRHFCTLSHQKLDYSDLMHAASDIFAEKKEMIALIKELIHQKARLFLLSNTCEAHFSYIKKSFSFLNFFEGFILSYEIHARKPEKKIYDIALKKAKAPMEECFYIDDIAEYVEKASQLGINGHHFQGCSDLIVNLENQGYKFSKKL